MNQKFRVWIFSKELGIWLNGTVLPLTNCPNLKLLYFSANDLFGDIPTQIDLLNRLLHLDLSDNNIRGSIPKELSNLTRLLMLWLQNNMLLGSIPNLSVSLVNLKELNLTNNEFYGNVPDGLVKKFGKGSFFGNEGKCGSSPLIACVHQYISGDCIGSDGAIEPELLLSGELLHRTCMADPSSSDNKSHRALSLTLNPSSISLSSRHELSLNPCSLISKTLSNDCNFDPPFSLSAILFSLLLV